MRMLTSVFGLTLGSATALALGLTAAIACVALMVHRHHHPKLTTGDPT